MHLDLVPLERWFADLGTPPRLDLGRSGATSLSVGALLALGGSAAEAALLDLSLDYGPGHGNQRLREALAGAAMVRDADEVLITHGATEALLLTIGAVCVPGDRVAVGVPAYGGLLAIPASLGCELDEVRVWREGSDQLDLSGLHRALAQGARLLIVNTPHNPTGAVTVADELETLARGCRLRGATLIVDEVAMGTLDVSARSATESAAFAEGAVVVISDLSKGLGVGGLRVGWLSSTDPELMAQVRGRKDATTIANSGPAELMAAITVEHSPKIRLGIRCNALANRDRLAAALGTRLVSPVDGLVALVSVEGDDRALADRLLRRHRVAVVPGGLFGVPGHVRVGLGLAAPDFIEALDLISGDPSLQDPEAMVRAG